MKINYWMIQKTILIILGYPANKDIIQFSDNHILWNMISYIKEIHLFFVIKLIRLWSLLFSKMSLFILSYCFSWQGNNPSLSLELQSFKWKMKRMFCCINCLSLFFLLTHEDVQSIFNLLQQNIYMKSLCWIVNDLKDCKLF